MIENLPEQFALHVFWWGSRSVTREAVVARRAKQHTSEIDSDRSSSMSDKGKDKAPASGG